jgi:hypothetical protein
MFVTRGDALRFASRLPLAFISRAVGAPLRACPGFYISRRWRSASRRACPWLSYLAPLALRFASRLPLAFISRAVGAPFRFALPRLLISRAVGAPLRACPLRFGLPDHTEGVVVNTFVGGFADEGDVVVARGEALGGYAEDDYGAVLCSARFQA